MTHLPTDPQPAPAGWLLIALRRVLPAVTVLAGVAIMALGSEVDLEGGAGIVSAGLAIYAMSWFYRASFDGDRERDREEAARGYLDDHGHWPRGRSRALTTAASTAGRARTPAREPAAARSARCVCGRRGPGPPARGHRRLLRAEDSRRGRQHR